MDSGWKEGGGAVLELAFSHDFASMTIGLPEVGNETGSGD
jgi:hypothetical protein